MGYYYMTGVDAMGKRYNFTVQVEDISHVLKLFLTRVDKWEITRTEAYRKDTRY